MERSGSQPQSLNSRPPSVIAIQIGVGEGVGTLILLETEERPSREVVPSSIYCQQGGQPT